MKRTVFLIWLSACFLIGVAVSDTARHLVGRYADADRTLTQQMTSSLTRTTVRIVDDHIVRIDGAVCFKCHR